MDINQKVDLEKEEDEFDGGITNAEKDKLKFEDEGSKTAEAEVDESKDMEFARAIINRNSSIEIKVFNPVEKKGGIMSKNYYVYEIVGKDKIGEVKAFRRFSEFEALRKKLKDNWPGIFIPAIPDKTIKSTDVKVIEERVLFLDHFVKKCARLDHIYYSEEFQLFLRSTGQSDEIIKLLYAFPPRSCSTIYNQYRILFPDFDHQCNTDKEEDISKRISKLKVFLSEVKTMRKTLKGMMEYRKEMKHLKGEFTKYISKEVVNRIKEESEKEENKKVILDYVDIEKLDDLEMLSKNLKVLKKDLESFFLITSDLSNIYKAIGESSGTIANTAKEIGMLKSIDKEVISDGLFKKVNRNDKIREVEKAHEVAREELRSANALRGLIFNMLEKQEIPMMLFVKNQSLANGIIELANRRRKCLEKEEEVLQKLADVVSVQA